MNPISKAKVKLFTSLQRKKYRRSNKMFVIEGLKMCREVQHSTWRIEAFVLLESKVEPLMPLLNEVPEEKIYVASELDFQKISSLQNPEGILAIVHFPHEEFSLPQEFDQDLQQSALFLEDIQDPGNFGTLLRTADWFGIKHVFASIGCVDICNPKVGRSSMGAIFRVNLSYLKNWEIFIQRNISKIWIADMEGESLDKVDFQNGDCLLLGNEAKGVSKSLMAIPQHKKVHIPGKGQSESLNVATAGAILMYTLSQKI